jgi:hypothetical protein
MNIDQSAQYYWNSLTRFNKPVKVIGVNDENYAVEAEGHVYVVPKANITLGPRVVIPPVTTAPKPEEPYWFALTHEEWQWLIKLNGAVAPIGSPWGNTVAVLKLQSHSNAYTNEWFRISGRTAMDLLLTYRYGIFNHKKIIDSYLPGGAYGKVVRQLWEEKLRRDGIVPK